MRKVVYATNISIDGCCDHTLFMPDKELMALGLIDDFHFVVQPIVAGKGRRLLEDLDLAETLNLKLAASRIFKSGVATLHYNGQQ